MPGKTIKTVHIIPQDDRIALTKPYLVRLQVLVRKLIKPYIESLRNLQNILGSGPTRYYKHQLTCRRLNLTCTDIMGALHLAGSRQKMPRTAL